MSNKVNSRQRAKSILRILLITDNHTPTGGAEHYFFELKSRLKQQSGMEVYSLGFGAAPSEGNDYRIFKGLKNKFSKLLWQLIPHPLMEYQLRKQLQAIQPDVIHLHNIKQYTASLLRAVQAYPVVQTIHDYGMVCPAAHNIHKNLQPCPTGMRLSCFWQHHVKHALPVYLALTTVFYKTRRHLQKTLKKCFAPSPLLVEYLRKNQFPDAAYIPPFIHTHQPVSFETVQPYHFLFAGNLGTHKGIYILLDEFALAKKSEPRLTLTIAGMGTEEKRMHQRVRELALEQAIHFTGWQASLDDEYKRCAAVIFPSVWIEAFGLIITEAMGHGRAVLGSNRGSPPWLIDDKQTGLIFDPLKKGDLAEKILRLAGDVDLIKTLGVNAHAKLQGFSDNEKVLGDIVGYYREAVKETSAQNK